MKTFVDLGARLFPDREITVTSGKNSHAIMLPGPVQAAIGLALIVGVSSTAAVAYRSIEAHRATVRERAIAIAQLKAELADVQGQAAKAEQTLVQLASLAQPNATADTDDLSHADPAELGEKINERIADLEARLQTLNAQKDSLVSDRERLASEKGKLQKSVGELKQAKDKEKEQELAIAKAVEAASAERDRLRQRVTDLEKKLQKLSLLRSQKTLVAQRAAADRAAADAVTLPASALAAAAPLGVVAAASEATPEASGQPSEAVAEADDAEDEGPSTASLPTGGFNLDRYLAQYGIGLARQGAAVGGPFVALGAAKVAGHGLTPEAAAVLRSVPLTAPMPSYRLESGFGVRVDPIRHRRSVHTGLDLSAPYQSPIYATSGGTVVFSGYSGAYGKMVEIDHGHGFHTRYAHLNRLMVNVGQHISEHTEIGLLGSTGRSTGPHCHYEVLVNGVQQNPLPFLNAGQGVVVKTAN